MNSSFESGITSDYVIPEATNQIKVSGEKTKSSGVENAFAVTMATARGSTPREALEELIELFLEDGGELELERAVEKLSPPNRDLVSNFGALEFVKRFPQLFISQRTRGKSKSKVMVKLDVPLEFCPQAGEKGGCVSSGCNRLHLCPFFIKGSCKFGVKCKRSHSYDDEHTVRVLDDFGLGFLITPSSSSLFQKILKMIVDESEIHLAAAKRSVPDICIFYNKGTCNKVDNCPYLHVCKHFIDGDCKFGEGCKREHDFSDPHNRRVLGEYDMDRISELKVLQCLKGGKRKHTVSASSDGDQKPDKTLPKATNSNDKEKDNEICGFNLRGKCNYGNSCIHRHTELPYLWEYAMDGDNNWQSFSSELNAALEHAYCDVKNDSYTVMITDVLYCVQFDNMTAVTAENIDDRLEQMKVEKMRQKLDTLRMGRAHNKNINEVLSAVNCKSPGIRRLSTVSSVVAAPGHVFSTRWNWYWQDENNKWQSYDTPDDGHAVNTTSSQCLEKEYMAEKNSHCFSASHHHYTLSFRGWYQQNDVHKTKRPVRRRPAEFVTKQNMKDIAAKRRSTAVLAHQRASSASSEADGFPTHWSPIPDGKEYSCVQLTTVSDEYKKTKKKFLETMEGSHHIIKIERVQNPDLWTPYTQKKSRMAKKAAKDPEERQLFHGTNPDTVEAICQQGFDWRMCGKHGTTYGKGSYFACKANYSHRYTAITSKDLNKQMFLARVLVGSYTKGNKLLTRPPPKDPSNPHTLYDSCCNDETNPALFVVFENGQSYPEFLITYV